MPDFTTYTMTTFQMKEQMIERIFSMNNLKENILSIFHCLPATWLLYWKERHCLVWTTRFLFLFIIAVWYIHQLKHCDNTEAKKILETSRIGTRREWLFPHCRQHGIGSFKVVYYSFPSPFSWFLKILVKGSDWLIMCHMLISSTKYCEQESEILGFLWVMSDFYYLVWLVYIKYEISSDLYGEGVSGRSVFHYNRRVIH